jgi:hypothetical protein
MKLITPRSCALCSFSEALSFGPRVRFSPINFGATNRRTDGEERGERSGEARGGEQFVSDTRGRNVRSVRGPSWRGI